jgi:hypothetical protein
MTSPFGRRLGRPYIVTLFIAFVLVRRQDRGSNLLLPQIRFLKAEILSITTFLIGKMSGCEPNKKPAVQQKGVMIFL